jgi:hypothetical protein
MAKMTLAEDEHPVGDLAAQCPHPPLREGAGPRALRRDPDHFDASAGEDRVEHAAELAAAVAGTCTPAGA